MGGSGAMRLGSEVDGLDGLAGALDGASRRLSSLRSDLSAMTTAAIWTGPDADRFRREWHGGLAPASDRASTALAAAAVDLRRQSAQQREASRPDLGGSAAGLTGGGIAGGSGNAVVPPAPSRVRIVTVAIGGGVEVVAGAHLTFRVEDLGHGRSRVTEVGDVTVGASASASTRVTLDLGDRSFAVGAGAGAAVQGLVGGAASWTIPTDDLETFLVAEAGEAALGTSGMATASLLGTIPGAGTLAGALGFGDEVRAASYLAPDPDRIDARVGLTGGAGAAGGVPGQSSSVGMLVAADGVAEASLHTADGSVVLRLDHAVGAAVQIPDSSGGSDGGAASTRSDVALQVDRQGRPLTLSVDRTTTSGASVTIEHAVVDLTDPAVTAAAGRLVGVVASGGSPAALGAAVDRVVMAGTATTASRTDVYDVASSKQYGLELPIGSAMVSTQELILQH